MTRFKGHSQWHLAGSPTCVATTSRRFQSTSDAPEGNPSPLCRHTPFPQCVLRCLASFTRV